MISVNELKNKIRKLNNKDNIPFEVLYQNFFFERFLERLSKSKYRSNFIIKGGYIVSTLVGLSDRTTSDIDITLVKQTLNEERLTYILEDIFRINMNDDVSIEISNIETIRLEDKYSGLRYTLYFEFKSIKYHFKLDFSTGDVITPNQRELEIPLYFTGDSIKLFTYPIETILSEKIETILSRNIANTRMKDFYDVYILLIRFEKLIDNELLKEAIRNTIKYRGTLFILDEFNELFLKITESEELKTLWIKYTSEYEFAKEIHYDNVMNQLASIINIAFK